MRRGLFILLVAGACSFSIVLYAKKPQKPVQKTFTEIVDVANHGVAAIVIPAGNYGLGLPIGSAFFIDEDYLASNAHVIRDAEKSAGEHWGIYAPVFLENGSRMVGYQFFGVNVVEVDDDYDLAILHVTNKPRRVPLPFSLAVGSLPIGTEVALTGFGLSAQFPATITATCASQTSQRFATEDPTLTQRLAAVTRFSSIFAIDKTIPGGFSGSPVYLKSTGVVYGVASGTIAGPLGGFGFVHPLKKLAEMLDKHSIPYSKVEPLDSFVNP
jgi:S1-C subfamily serine protease